MENQGIAVVENEELSIAKMKFKPTSWVAKINFIRHLILHNNLLMAVIAEAGGGKTSFAEILKSELEQEIAVYSTTADPSFEEDNLHRDIAQAFNLSLGETPSLAAIAHAINEAKKSSVIIIDNAQNLPHSYLTEILTQLKNYPTENFFHVCLIADFSLTATLNTLEKESFESLIHSFELGTLTVSETKTYLLNGLFQEGKKDKKVSNQRLEHFYQLTGGDLAQINSKMRDYFKRELEAKAKNTFTKPLSLAASIVLVFLFALFWNKQEIPLFTVIQENPSEQIVAQNNHELLVSEIPAWHVAVVREALPPIQSFQAEFTRGVDADKTSNNQVAIGGRDPHQTSGHQIAINSKLPKKKSIKSPEIKFSSVDKIAGKQINLAAKAVLKDSKYSIQLLASPAISDLKQFMRKHPKLADARVQKILIKGKIWYVLTMGGYTQLEQAKTAIAHLSPDLMRSKPWIRVNQSLHAIA